MPQRRMVVLLAFSPERAQAAERTLLEGRLRYSGRQEGEAAPVAKCREAYERLPEFEKVRGPKLASKSKQDFNPYLNYGLEHYDDALRESKELMMKYVEALSKRRDLTATVIVLSLQTLQDKLAQIFPPLQLSKLQWPECGTMDATSFDISDTWRQPFSVEPAFLAALCRLDTTLQRLAHELETDGGFFKTPWPAMVTVGRVEALMVINISQLQYVAASVLRLEVGDCGERPLGSEEVAAAAAARKASLRAAKAKRQRTEVRGADSEVSEDSRAGSSRDREDQESSRGHHLQAYDPFEAWEHGGTGATSEFNSAGDPSIEALRGMEAFRNSSQPSLGLDLSEQTLDDDEDGNDRNAAVAGDKGVEEEMSVTRTAQLYKHACVMHMRASGAQVGPVP
ncbi:hypothetical protein BCV69DRAFT_295781 [Microstroma glucosiphilum]|uniref:Uncharacterized protein n=1 Tax=Pseudomicrostroma glucosiphilum TaxID=1684307 RepID=A0A316TWT7_9BASI|nr:hypothetical protein BCV69DRAFT_295781 [Pseudomicrostroma glucosiphilum]PWN17670.1 hypothetical protein BCV69DRAFT_295781 [Pseudomicrostroma glucosiphilum]